MRDTIISKQREILERADNAYKSGLKNDYKKELAEAARLAKETLILIKGAKSGKFSLFT